jgi:signal transduction histidine kinase
MSIRLHFSILSHKIDQSAKDYFSQQMEVLQALEVKIRDISHNLNRDAFLQNQTFGVLIQNLATDLETIHHLSINLSNETKIRWDLYPNDYKINIFRTIQESLQNCVKYAKAKEIKISFLDENGTLTWQISDDGVGFDVRKKKKGIGLKNMMSRMTLMNGTMEILSEKNRGTTMIFEIPSKSI